MKDQNSQRPRNQLLSKWYTRSIGIFSLLVAISLLQDLARFGFRPETFHKIFHVLVGGLVVWLGWHNPSWWRLFPWVNGGFFFYVGMFGWVFPDFGQLDAFNRLDTILHSVVGVSGLGAGLWEARAARADEVR